MRRYLEDIPRPMFAVCIPAASLATVVGSVVAIGNIPLGNPVLDGLLVLAVGCPLGKVSALLLRTKRAAR